MDQKCDISISSIKLILDAFPISAFCSGYFCKSTKASARSHASMSIESTKT